MAKTFVCRHCKRRVPNEGGGDDAEERAVGPICARCAGRLRWLVLDGFAGRTSQPIWLVGETTKRYRIRAIDGPVRLGGRSRQLSGDATALVPKQALREHPIGEIVTDCVVRECVNTHDQLVAAGGGVAIMPHRPPGSDRPSAWQVYLVHEGVAKQTDPDGPWYHRGRKAFLFGGDKAAALARAQDYVRERFGIKVEWRRNRMGDYVPADINERHPLRPARGK